MFHLLGEKLIEVISGIITAVAHGRASVNGYESGIDQFAVVTN